MSAAVLDSSALLAVLFAEPGAERVVAYLPGALLSTVNAGEVASVLVERGVTAQQARYAIEKSAGRRRLAGRFAVAHQEGDFAVQRGLIEPESLFAMTGET